MMRALIVPLLLLLGACGAASAPVPRTAAGPGVVQAPAGKAGSTHGVPYGGNPLLTLYVEGPDPVADPDATAGVYQTVITVVNEGAAPAELGVARPSFEVWMGDERRECAEAEAVDVPAPLASGDSYTFVARAECPVAVGEGGEPEVRVYVQLQAEGGDVELERHYAGRYFIR